MRVRMINIFVLVVWVHVQVQPCISAETPLSSSPLSTNPSTTLLLLPWKQVLTNVRKLQNQGKAYDALYLLEQYQPALFSTPSVLSLSSTSFSYSSTLSTSILSNTLTKTNTNPQYTLEYLEQYAELLDLVKNYTAAITVREYSIDLLREYSSTSSTSKDPSSTPQFVPKFETIMKTYIQLIDSYNHNFQYDEALSKVQYLYQLVQHNNNPSSSSSSSSKSTSIPTSMLAGVQRIEAHIKDCQSHTLTFPSFLLYCKSLGYPYINTTVWYSTKYTSLLPYYPPLNQPLQLPSPGSKKLAHDYLQLLHRVIAEYPVTSQDDFDTSDQAAYEVTGENIKSRTKKFSKNKYFVRNLSSLLNHTITALLVTGPYEYRNQIPRTYIPGLTSQPWHSYTPVDVPYYDDITHARIPIKKSFQSELESLILYLRSRIPYLRDEYIDQLRNRNKLYRETECIHDAANGLWYYYIPTGYWVQNKDNANCSVDTPVACETIRTIPSYLPPHIKLLRTGYSSILNRTYLRPHYGLTNTQLKLHLSLIIPRTKDNQPCSFITVGNYTRTWSDDSSSPNHILFFDDSYIHHVIHKCDEERVIFQVVLSHPDIPSIEEYNDVLPYSSYH